jgi:hypothetical protein
VASRSYGIDENGHICLASGQDKRDFQEEFPAATKVIAIVDDMKKRRLSFLQKCNSRKIIYRIG